MNSQQRILEILIRLMNGETLFKQILMEEYGKSSSVIQRDIKYIDELLSNEGRLQTPLLTNGKDKGKYCLSEPYYLNSFNRLTDEDVFILSSILTSSRALNVAEYKKLLDKIIGLGSNKIINTKKQLGNDILEYRGVPDEAISGKIFLILDVIKGGRGIEFSYTKNYQTMIFKRTPLSVFFSDLYFFVATDNHHSEDGSDFEHLNKFRINNMKNKK